MSRTAVIILGMPNSGSSAMAGVLGEMGCDQPTDPLRLTEIDLNGVSESRGISLVNEEIFAAAGIKSFDLGRLTDTWSTVQGNSDFRHRGKAALAEAFPASNLLVIKDHRIWRLVPFWDELLIQQRVRPVYVCMIRDPVKTSTWLTSGAGLKPHYGQLLWLRHVLDSELSTRGKTRTFITHDQLFTDWRTLVRRISVNLDVEFPRSLESVAAAVGQLLSTEMMNLSSGKLPIAKLEESPQWIVATWQVLASWSENREDPSDYAILDHVRSALNESSDTLSSIFEKLPARDQELDRIRHAHTEASKSADFLSAKLIQATVEIENHESRLAAGNIAFQDTWRRLQNLQKELKSRTDDLRNARLHPINNVRTFLEFRALRMLSSSENPLPRSLKARFRGAADNRSPYRNLPLVSDNATKASAEFENVRSRKGQVAFRPDIPSIIVVSHDASRTGAPILALNLARALSTRYNVITVCLRGGELISDFRQHSTSVHIAEHVVGSRAQYGRLLDEIVSKSAPLFAIVNSIESRYILGALKKKQIPSIALFHEFASYTLPKSAFTDAFHLADKIVFSTELTIKNAMQQTSFVRTPRFHVLAQGRCRVPQSGGVEALGEVERDRLSALLRVEANMGSEFVVIGAGYVHIRKGVDLFIDVARRVLATECGKNARFIWIGAGYDPERDSAYSVVLQDQIERAQLTERMMLGETSEIEHVYKLSNLLLLTSRLDPLPNVAIDALSEGMPVVCFDKTTGIADALTEAGLRDACVADYLDTAQAAEKVLNLIRSKENYRQVCDVSKTYASQAFDFEKYAVQIEHWGLETAKVRALRSEDVSMIASAEDFDPSFAMPPHLRASTKVEAAEYYVGDGWREVVPRRPEAGFNPLAYARQLEEMGVTGVNAYTEFLRRGRPNGPWLRPVITKSVSDSLFKGKVLPRTVLHIHTTYPDQANAISDRLALNKCQPDLFISAGDRKSLDSAVEAFKGYRGRIAQVRVVPDRGCDLGPLLTEFGRDLVRDYDVIGHVTTLDSGLPLDRHGESNGTDLTLENLIGGKRAGAMLDRIVEAFTERDHLGIVFPADPRLLTWSTDMTVAQELARRLKLDQLPKFVDFPVGSMFWIRAAALEPLTLLGLDWDDYPRYPKGNEAAIIDDLKRMFGLVAESRGFEVAVTNVGRS